MFLAAPPLNGFPEALVERHLGGEAERVAGAGGVEAAAGLAVRFGLVPNKLAFKTGEVFDLFSQVFDGDLKAGAQVDRFGAVVVLGGQGDATGGVFDVEKLAAGRAGAPDGYFRCAAIDRLTELADQSGDDVGLPVTNTRFRDQFIIQSLPAKYA